MPSFKYIQREATLIQQFSRKYNKKITPCTIEEVKELELMLPDSYNFPVAYKEFLLCCGKESAEIFYSTESGYEAVKKRLLTQNKRIIRRVQLEDIPDKKELPIDLFVVEEVDYCDNFTYLLLEEGENPPIYFWEEGEGGLEVSEKLADSFSDYLREKIRTKANFLLRNIMSKRLENGDPPRGQQFWLPSEIEKTEGIAYENLKKRFRLFRPKIIEKATAICGVDTYSYLEELSGWKARKVGDEVRFFPPSYESPEEKEKKASLLQNKIEEKQQELAKVEKRIANYQARIKNLSGGVLTGGINFFDNPSRLRIKELEKDLIKQKVVKQNLKKEITKLEDSSN